MSNFKLNEKTTDFLLYSYFGFDSNDTEQEVRYKCAYRAYLDLARTVKYRYTSAELESAKKNSNESKFKTDRDGKINDICKEINKHINNYPENQSNFNSWHAAMCEMISGGMNELIKTGEEFTYGQAQKWVNMALKYMWLLDLLPERISPESLHVPIDSFILEALEDKINEISNDGDTYKYQGKAWSAISDPVDYKKLQDKIRGIVKEDDIKAPIEWESHAWMEIAKRRSNK